MIQARERELRKFIAAGSGLDSDVVIPGNDTGPRPGGAYATVLEISSTPRGYPIKRFVSIDDGTDQLSLYEGLFSVQWYRAGAGQMAENFREWVFSDNGLIAAEGADLRVTNPFDILKTDEVVDKDWEERYSASVPILYAVTTRQDTGYITNGIVDLCYDTLPEERITYDNS